MILNNYHHKIIGMNYWIYLFYEDVLLTKYKASLDYIQNHLKDCGNECILEGLKQGNKLPEQIKAYHKFLQKMKQRKVDKAGIHKNNHLMVLGCLASLVKLKQLEEYDAYIILKDKSKRTA